MFHVKHPEARQVFEQVLGDLVPDSELLAKLLAHWELVREWNARTNLTSIRTHDDAANLHYRDSLEVISHLQAGPVLDIGSGAGFPGIPIAIVTGREVALLEPRQKRRTFLVLAKSRLGLSNVQVLAGRHSDRPPRLFSNVVTRATFSKGGQIQECLAWADQPGRLIAMRAPPPSGSSNACHGYQVGGRDRILEIWTSPEGQEGPGRRP